MGTEEDNLILCTLSKTTVAHSLPKSVGLKKKRGPSKGFIAVEHIWEELRLGITNTLHKTLKELKKIFISKNRSLEGSLLVGFETDFKELGIHLAPQ